MIRGALMDESQVDELIQFLQKYELSIARLYETFADIIPSSRKAWLSYATEERLHAKWIKTLHSLTKKGKLSFEQTKFTKQATKTAIDYIENQIEKIMHSKNDLEKALTLAINIEKSLLESTFFRLFKPNAPKAKKIQARLEAATKDHIGRLIEWHKDIKKS